MRRGPGPLPCAASARPRGAWTTPSRTRRPAAGAPRRRRLPCRGGRPSGLSWRDRLFLLCVSCCISCSFCACLLFGLVDLIKSVRRNASRRGCRRAWIRPPIVETEATRPARHFSSCLPLVDGCESCREPTGLQVGIRGLLC